MKQIKSKVVTMLVLFAILLTGITTVLALTPEKVEVEETEVVEYRGLFEKHFKNADGTMSAATYINPIHYKDEKGNWVDIDNTLIRTENGYTNKDNPVKVQLTDITKSEQMIKVSYDKYELSFGIVGVNETNGEVAEVIKKEEKTELPNLISQITYKNAFKDADLSYKLMSYRVVEDIIFNSIPEFDIITYNVELNNLSAKLEDNNVIFYSNETEKEIFRFEAPFMFDSAEKPVLTENVKTKLETTEKGYTVVYEMDREWLESKDRVYPVTLDPTMKSDQHFSNIEDTHTNSYNPNSNYVNSQYLHVGKYNGQSYSFIRITNMPIIPAGNHFTGAFLEFFLNYGTGSWGNLEIRELYNAWNSYTLTWNNQLTLVNNSQLVASNVQPVNYAGYKLYSINISNTGSHWYSSGNYTSSTNFGVMVRYQDPNYNDFNWLYSSDAPSSLAAYRPAVIVYYEQNDPTPPPPPPPPVDPNLYDNCGWIYPVAGFNNISRGYSSNHYAIDIDSYGSGQPTINGTPIIAPAKGIVRQSGNHPSAGNWIVVQTECWDDTTDTFLRYVFMHLKSAPLVPVNAIVGQNQLLGYVGNTGSVWPLPTPAEPYKGSHLHFEVLRNGGTSNGNLSGANVNPERFYSNGTFGGNTSSAMY